MANRRITKEMASYASAKMKDAVYKEKIEAAKRVLNTVAEKYIKKYLPAPVLACTEEYKDYIASYKRAKFEVYNQKTTDGDYTGGYKSIYADISFDVPQQPCGYGGYPTFKIVKNEAEDIVKAEEILSNLGNESMNFQDKMFNALASLKTEKSVTENLPEALPYIEFPGDKNNVPAPIFSELRDMLKSITNNQ